METVMPATNRLPTVFAALSLALLAGQAGAHRHESPAPSTNAVTARHATTPELVEAMDRIRNAVEAFEHARHGHMGPTQVRALSDHLDAQIAHAFSTCRLPPDADASLHSLLGVLAKASRAMREEPGRFEPVLAMERALADYARVFTASPAPAR